MSSTRARALPQLRSRAVARRVGALAVTTALAVGTLTALTAPPALAAGLDDLAAARGKDVGFALDPGRLSEAPYKAIADSEFNLVVAENAMKWDATEPSRNQFSWGNADRVRDYAESTGKELYGHTLVWHSQLPDWAKNLPAADLRAAMLNHIAVVAGRYAGDVASWDVVNEAFSDSGGVRRQDSPFQQKLGDGYIEEAFRAARAADPDADLCINDYSTDGINAKSTAIYNLVRDFKARGVPIDCVGFQAHLIVGQVPGDMQQNLQRFADLGVDVRVTELDIRIPTPADAQELAQQKADYQRVFTICNAVTRCQGVTLWGITDKYSWVPGVFSGQGAALVWDDNYAKKPAYDGIVAALGGATPNPTPTTPNPTPTTPGPTPTTPGPTPTQNPGGACAVTYGVNQWNTGFTANVTVRNTSSTAVNGWTLRWTFPSGQSVTQAWSSVATQSGTQVSATNAAWNAQIPAGGSVSFGFNGSHGGTNTRPTAFSLNGTACSVS